MSEVNSFHAADDFTGELCVLLSDFDAQRLRADTAEAENRILRHSNASFLETVTKVCDLLGIDLDDAKHADGQPSDVLFSHAKGQAEKLAAAEQRIAELEALLNTPHTADWFEGVKLEAGHQIQRWGSGHDAGKGPADWFWLIGYLAQKAMTSQMLGNEEKAKHHTISTGAALLNWFRAITGDSNAMRSGIDVAALNPNPEAAKELWLGMEEMPEHRAGAKYRMILDDTEQVCEEIEMEGSKRWFYGEENGAFPEDEIQAWLPINPSPEAESHE